MPVDPTQLVQDPDFQAAAPADQIKYLSNFDPDFAKASPQDQMGYLSHVTGKPATVSNPDPSTLGPGLPKPPNAIDSAQTDLLGKAYEGNAPGIKQALQIPVAMAKDVGSQVANSFQPYATYQQVSGQLGQLKNAAKAYQQERNSGGGVMNAISSANDAAAPPSGYDQDRASGKGIINSAARNLPVVGDIVQDAQAGNYGTAAGKALVRGAGLLGGKEALGDTPVSDISSAKYSPQGDYVAASMRPNVRIDVPAEAHAAFPALEEGLADRGYSTKDFTGRNGPKVLQSGLDNAMRIQEERAQQVIDPIRNEPVDPKVLAANPELQARLGDKPNPTYGDVDAERVKMNKELRRANFYSKDPTAQNAAGDALENTETAVNQARDLVYGKAQQTTGIDLRPLKQTESSLLKMTDLANTTSNGLSAMEAKFNATPTTQKLAQSAKKIIALKSNPISSFASYETPGMTSPLESFNRNLKNAFPKLKPSPANTKVTFPSYNLNLTHPAGQTPQPIFQRMLLNQAQGVGDDHDVPGAPPLDLTPSGDIPPALQRVLPLTSGAPPSEIYPGLRYPKGKK